MKKIRLNIRIVCLSCDKEYRQTKKGLLPKHSSFLGKYKRECRNSQSIFFKYA